MAPLPAVLAALVLLLGCSSGDGGARGATAPAPAVPVTVATAARRDAPVTLRTIGTVDAYASVAVRAQVEGQLARAHVAEGQEVQAGDPLFLIDPRPFEAALHEAEARLARTRAEADRARVEAGRFARLVRSGVVSRDEYDRTRTQAAALAAAVAADEAAVASARIRLQYCDIRAPLGGRIGQRLVDEGNVVEANETTLAVINQLRPVHVSFSVPQQELPGIRRHMAEGALPVEAFWADDTSAGVGALTFVDNQVDQTTGTVLLKAEFPNAGEQLWPGQFVNVVLQLAVRPDVVMVPGRAVQPGQAGPWLFVVRDDGTVEARSVAVGETVGEEVVVERGVEAGERVVTEGQLRLAPGMRVEAKDAA
jgi:multidrug efflux system membrane fusion protein